MGTQLHVLNPEGEFCQERLTGYKRPKAFHIVPDLPRTRSGPGPFSESSEAVQRNNK